MAGLVVVWMLLVSVVRAQWPVVDCGALFDLESPSHNDSVAHLRSALLGRGFFYAANVSMLSASYLEDIYSLARRMHALPVEVKRQYARPLGGYTGPDVGVEELAYEKGKKSTVRAWDYAREENSFVSRKYPPGMEEALSELFDRQAHVSKNILTAVAEALGIERDGLSKHAESGDLGTIRLLRYPPKEAEEDSVGVGAHTDFEAFTLMHQSSPGLQLRAKDSFDWEVAPVYPDMFVVIIGDVLERMTNGVLKATPHRVLPSDQERFSIIRFNAFAPDAVVEPMGEFTTADRPSAYSKTTMAEIMETVISSLEQGNGAWDDDLDVSTTATMDYRSHIASSANSDL